MTDHTGSMYNAYDGKNNTFHALADNSVGQAIFLIDDESFEKKIITYQREFYASGPQKNAYERFRTTQSIRKIFENCNIITVSYDTGRGTDILTEKYCWQYNISFEHAWFFAALMGTETLLYKDRNTITIYEGKKPQSSITVYPESHIFESTGVRMVFELLFRLLDTQKRIITISMPQGIFLRHEQRKYIHGAGMYIPRKSYTELMESPPVIYVSNNFPCDAYSAEPQNTSYAIQSPILTADMLPEARHDKSRKVRQRCRRLVKNSGLLILYPQEDCAVCTGTEAAEGIFAQAAAKKISLDEHLEKIRPVYKTVLFQFIAASDTPAQKSMVGFYVQFDCERNLSEQLCTTVAAARTAGIATVLYVPGKKPAASTMQETLTQIQVISTEDAKPVFSLSMQDGYDVLSQLLSILHNIPCTLNTGLWNMQYVE